MDTVELKYLDRRVLRYIPPFGKSSWIQLHALLDNPLQIEPNEMEFVHTGLSIYIKHYYLSAMVISARDDIMIKKSMTFIRPREQYELLLPVVNTDDEPRIIEPYDHIADLFFTPVVEQNWTLVREFSEYDCCCCTIL